MYRYKMYRSWKKKEVMILEYQANWQHVCYD